MQDFSQTSEAWPSTDMNERNWRSDRWAWALAYSFIILLPVALLLTKGFALGWLAVLMGLGPLLAGLWLFATNQLEVQGKLVRETSVERLVQSFIVAVVIGFGAFLVILLGSGSRLSYDFLKIGGLWTYILLGLPPVVAYAAIIQRLLAKRWSLGWAIGLGVVSLFAPWFWAGFTVYAAYHTL